MVFAIPVVVARPVPVCPPLRLRLVAPLVFENKVGPRLSPLEV